MRFKSILIEKIRETKRHPLLFDKELDFVAAVAWPKDLTPYALHCLLMNIPIFVRPAKKQGYVIEANHLIYRLAKNVLPPSSAIWVIVLDSHESIPEQPIPRRRGREQKMIEPSDIRWDQYRMLVVFAAVVGWRGNVAIQMMFEDAQEADFRRLMKRVRTLDTFMRRFGRRKLKSIQRHSNLHKQVEQLNLFDELGGSND